MILYLRVDGIHIVKGHIPENEMNTQSCIMHSILSEMPREEKVA